MSTRRSLAHAAARVSLAASSMADITDLVADIAGFIATLGKLRLWSREPNVKMK
jgi:hypothetical protein